MCILFIPANKPEKKEEQKSEQKQQQNARLKDNNENTDKLELTKTDQNGAYAKVVDPSKCDAAGLNYTGIGITYSTFTQRIIDAPTSYPAYQAGIRANDTLVNPKSAPDAEGYVTVRIIRDDLEMVFKIKQTKICYEDVTN